MSNTQHPRQRALANGGQPKPPSQIDLLSVIAGGMQSLAQHATRQPSPMQMQCAICIGWMKAWEARHLGDVQQLVAAWQQRQAAFGEALQAAAGDPEQQQVLAANAPPDLQSQVNLYGEQINDPCPKVNLANTLITTAELGTVLACAGHVPALEPQAQNRLVAVTGCLSSSMIAQLRSQR
jgi:hypothetical protein